MNTNTIPGQALAHYDPEVAQRVQGWIDSGKPLVWIPILSQENFPDMPPEILQWIEARQAALHVPISEPADLLRMPEGVTGWLMPEGDADTDVACGVWAGELYILGVKDKRTGRPQTLLGERFDVATGQVDDAGQSAVLLGLCPPQRVHAPVSTHGISAMTDSLKSKNSIAAQLAALPNLPMPELWAL